MAYLAVRGSGAVNGVSRLHGEVSRQIFEPLFPRWPEDEVPVGYVTNGVHMPNWDSAPADDLWTEACGKDRWLGTTETLEAGDSPRLRRQPLEFPRRRPDVPRRIRPRAVVPAAGLLRRVAGRRSTGPKHLFDPERADAGIRAPFRDLQEARTCCCTIPTRLLRLLSNSERPVQLILAGKAHPADQAGQALIQKWVQFIRRPEVRPHAIFLSDYDMLLTEHLVQGVDVWINTPRRPWEASGTSGMKVLVNGGINLSELDGWWAEAYTPEVGWALGRRPGAWRRSGLGRCRGRSALRPARTRSDPGVLRARQKRHSHRLGQADATKAWRA